MENPGPTSTITKTPRWRFPCGVCEKLVKLNQKGICCDSCDRLFHTRCCGVGEHMYNILSVSPVRGFVAIVVSQIFPTRSSILVWKLSNLKTHSRC